MTNELHAPLAGPAGRSALDEAIVKLEQERAALPITLPTPPATAKVGDLRLMPEVFAVRGPQLDEYHLGQLARALAQRGELEPLMVLPLGPDLVVVDGFHRVEAYRRANRPNIPIITFEGSVREAVLVTAECNTRAVLPMANRQRQDLAWLLVNANFTLRQVTSSTGISRAQVGIMRKVKKALGEDALDQQTWYAAHRLAKGKDLLDLSEDELEAMLEARVQAVADKLRRVFSNKLATQPEILARALAIYAGRKLGEVVDCLREHLPEDDDNPFGREF